MNLVSQEVADWILNFIKEGQKYGRENKLLKLNEIKKYAFQNISKASQFIYVQSSMWE